MEDSTAFTSPSVVIGESYITIRGIRLRLDDLMDSQQLARENALRLREGLSNAEPFPHLVLKGLFNDRLLELIHDEFDLVRETPWKRHFNQYEDTRRSNPGSKLGPAAQLYFWLVSAGEFADFLSSVSGVQDLIPDPQLWGGGMHETLNRGHFSIHRDFENHLTNGLQNAMVFITYLNKDWLPTYEGSLELWGKQRKQCLKKVPPDFGSSLLLPHGPNSYHGYATPLNIPSGRSRRSVASYYYTNQSDAPGRPRITVSKFLFPASKDIAKGAMKQLIPPLVWNALKKLKR
jgi:hypothetical protein